ncbi:MAG: 50S ribosomal protein L23 [Vampirovibrionales bacterium]|nr:50S ribosomal protein L23 [Vampirovibrionales bacterium]
MSSTPKSETARVQVPSLIQKAKAFDLLKTPVITEKATAELANNCYTFIVDGDVNKTLLKHAFMQAFPGRKVLAIRTVKRPSQAKRLGRFKGKSQEQTKAIFKIAGEPIDLGFGEV